ncbi:MAG: hypothetical protein OXH94_15245 [Rhodospirillales bacterium]|nr:hypothetical protein [Rhodospirillales bacterium]
MKKSARGVPVAACFSDLVQMIPTIDGNRNELDEGGVGSGVRPGDNCRHRQVHLLMAGQVFNPQN